MAVDADGDDVVGEFVESGLVDGMVVGWVLLVTFLDPESGEHRYYGDTMQGQPSTTTLGLAQAIATIESEQIRRVHFAQIDGDR